METRLAQLPEVESDRRHFAVGFITTPTGVFVCTHCDTEQETRVGVIFPPRIQFCDRLILMMGRLRVTILM